MLNLDQRRYVMASLRKEVHGLERFEPGDPAPYVNCRPWGAIRLLLGGGDLGRDEVRAIKWTLKQLETDGEITLYRADGLIVGVWLGRPLGTGRTKVPAADRQAVMERDGYACVLCDATSDLTLDHIFPAVSGGSNDPINLRVLCRSCNSSKGTSVPPEILRLRAR